MPSECPNVLRTLVIGDDPKLLAKISCVLVRRGAYLPILEGPRMQRMDRDAEVIRRNNAAARLQPNRIILAGLDDGTCRQFTRYFPARKIQRVSRFEELPEVQAGNRQADTTALVWGHDNIGLGLMTALRARQTITFSDDPSPKPIIPSESGHFVVCEEGDELAQVVAANYAQSLRAGFCVIPEVDDEHAQGILNQFYGLYEPADRSPTESLLEIRKALRACAGDIPVASARAITFVTKKLPWGFAYPEVPTTHFFRYPDLGISMLNGVTAEQRGAPGIRVAALVDPKEVDAAEIQAAVKSLSTRSVFIRGLRSRGATVYEVSRMIELYPYDLLLISTHCGDAKGWRWTYEFVDREGHHRTLVVDLAISIAVVPGSEKLDVMRYTRFVSLDGVDWNDPEKKKRLYVGTAILDYLERISGREEMTPVKRESVGRVVWSSALRMFDGNFIAVPRSLADHGSPIVLNNACASWHRLAETFMFGNARAYIGTLVGVTDTEAQEVATRLLDRHFGKPLAVALWHAQNEVYADGARRPYVLVGAHFQRLRTTSIDAPIFIYKHLVQARNMWRRDPDGNDPSDEAKRLTTKDYVQYLEREAHGIRKRWLERRAKER